MTEPEASAQIDDDNIELGQLMPFYQSLLTIGLMFTAAGMGTYIMRRKVFPLNGRVTSFVIIWASVFVRSFTEEMVAGIDNHDRFPCWYLVARAHIETFGINVVFVRIFRLWYLLFTSKERLSELRGKRARAKMNGGTGTHVSKCSAYSAGSGLSTDLDGLSTALVCEFKAKQWFVKRAYLAKNASLWKVILGLSFLDSLSIQLVFWLARGANRCAVGGSVDIAELIVVGRIFLILLVIFAFAYRIRNESDNYSIKTEFKLLGWVVLLILPFYALELTDIRDRSTAARATFDGIRWCITMLALYSVLWFPILKSYGISPSPSTPIKFLRRKLGDKRRERKSKRRHSASSSYGRRNSKRRMSHEPSLKDILSTDKFGDDRADFEDLLAKEFSIENLQFYEAALALHEIGEAMSDGEVATFAVEVYRDFIADESPSEINIPHTLKQAVVDLLEKHIANFAEVEAQLSALDHATLVHESMLKLASPLPHDLYEPARKAVYSLMANDTYQRWLRRRRSLTYVPERARSPSQPKRMNTCSRSAAAFLSTESEISVPSAKFGTSVPLAKSDISSPSAKFGASVPLAKSDISDLSAKFTTAVQLAKSGTGTSLPSAEPGAASVGARRLRSGERDHGHLASRTISVSKPTHRRRGSDASITKITSNALFEVVVKGNDGRPENAVRDLSPSPPPAVRTDMMRLPHSLVTRRMSPSLTEEV